MTPEQLAAQTYGLTPDEIRRLLDRLRSTAMIDPTALVHPTAKVWHFSVVLAEAILAEGVSIGSHCEVGRGSMIGARSRIGSGTFLPPNTTIGTNVFVGPHVMMCDDKTPFVHGPDDPPYTPEPPVIDDNAVIGAACVLLPGVRIGKGARIGAGAVVTKDVPDGAHVRGEPARVHVLSSTSAGQWIP